MAIKIVLVFKWECIMNTVNDPRVGYSREDWERHYDEKDLRWDIDEVAPPFVHL